MTTRLLESVPVQIRTSKLVFLNGTLLLPGIHYSDWEGEVPQFRSVVASPDAITVVDLIEKKVRVYQALNKPQPMTRECDLRLSHVIEW